MPRQGLGPGRNIIKTMPKLRNETLEKAIGGCTVTIEFFAEDGKQRQFVDIEDENGACSSFAKIEDTGTILTQGGEEKPFPQDTLEEIQDWLDSEEY
jgi:hypothetical protein|tara:strand:- start:275 stop:565 length:291 start_codon:yes stop_codon:yes gene_type:complete